MQSICFSKIVQGALGVNVELKLKLILAKKREKKYIHSLFLLVDLNCNYQKGEILHFVYFSAITAHKLVFLRGGEFLSLPMLLVV